MNDRTLQKVDGVLALAVSMAMFVVYRETLLPGVGYSVDCAKFQFLGRTLGIPHATGYPLYLLLLRAFDALSPIDSAAYNANVFSAICGALACGVCVLAIRLAHGSRGASVVAAAALGVTPVVWAQSIVAEVYALHALLLATTVSLFLAWGNRPRDRTLIAACACYALSFGNHLLVATSLPAIVAFVILRDRRVVLRWRTVLAIAACVAAGALQYGYLFWISADPSAYYIEREITSLHDLVAFTSGGQFRDAMFSGGWPTVRDERVPLLFRRIGSEQAWLVPFAIAGLARGPLRSTVFLLLVFAGGCVLFLGHRVVDSEVHLISAHVMVAVLAGRGMTALTLRIPQPRVRIVVIALLALVPAWMWWSERTVVNQNTDAARAYATLVEATARSFPEGAVVVSQSPKVALELLYVQATARPSISIHVAIHHNPPLIDAYLRALTPIGLLEQRRTVEPGRPVYCVGDQLARRLRDHGLATERVRPLVYRVRLAD